MKKTFRKTTAMLCAITVMASSMSFSGFVANANGEPVTSDYTLTIPATLAVANSGWNSIGDLTATGTLAQGKKLNVTATSENSWKLTSGENTVAYKLCGETEKTKTYAEATDTTSLDISKESLEQTDGFSVPIGIVVEDYSTKPAGDYSDTVTFTAKVEDAVVIHTTLSVGDVIHLGEVLSISTTYFGGGQAIQSTKSPFTLVRANITSNPGFDTTVTEAEDGQYYVLKGSDGSYCVYIGTPGTSQVEATSTSDGIIVNTLNGNTLYFTTHEPQ